MTRCVTRMMAMALAVALAAATIAVGAPVGVDALPPQSPPADAVMTPVVGPVGTEVTLSIAYDAGITVWCTEEVDGAVSPEAGALGWSVALLFTDASGGQFAVPAGWSRTAGVPALPMGPLPDGNSVTVTFMIPDMFTVGTYTGVGGCVSPDGAQPGPGIADLVLEVVEASASGDAEAVAPLVAAAVPSFTG